MDDKEFLKFYQYNPGFSKNERYDEILQENLIELENNTKNKPN